MTKTKASVKLFPPLFTTPACPVITIATSTGWDIPLILAFTILLT
jgi:hypothetical protein